MSFSQRPPPPYEPSSVGAFCSGSGSGSGSGSSRVLRGGEKKRDPTSQSAGSAPHFATTHHAPCPLLPHAPCPIVTPVFPSFPPSSLESLPPSFALHLSSTRCELRDPQGWYMLCRSSRVTWVVVPFSFFVFSLPQVIVRGPSVSLTRFFERVRTIRYDR